jgi:hypothetical protein
VQPEGGASSGCDSGGVGGGVGTGDGENFALSPGLFVRGVVGAGISRRRNSGDVKIGVLKCCVGETETEFEAGCDIFLSHSKARMRPYETG